MSNIDKELVFLNKIYPSISSIYRYSTISRLKQESVAEHSYFVTFISSLLYDKYKDKYSINFQKMIKIAMIHDFDEIITGDMVYDAKYLKGINIKFEKEKIIRDIFGINGNSVRIYKDYLKKRSIESNIVKFADWISMYIYCLNEVKMGNKHFDKLIIVTKEKIKEFLDEFR